MPQNIYDNEQFFSGYITLPRQVHGLDGAPEWPAVRAMLPDMAGKRVVDMGCGFGWFSRWAKEHGALLVLGLDVSENMISRARADTFDAAIEYRIEDLEVLELPEASFDFAYSSLAFHYVEDFDRLVRMVYRSLTPGSHFVFEIEHPIFIAGRESRWLEHGGRKVWSLRAYSVEGERRDEWFNTDVLLYHRTLATTVNTLIAAGFVIERMEEFGATAEQVEDDPELWKDRDRPLFLAISTRR